MSKPTGNSLRRYLAESLQGTPAYDALLPYADEMDRLVQELQSIAREEEQARKCVADGSHNTTFAIVLAGRASQALEGVDISWQPNLGDTTQWSVTTESNGYEEVTCHSRVVDGVLCRWWGDGPEPKGVATIDKAVKDATPKPLYSTSLAQEVRSFATYHHDTPPHCKDMLFKAAAALDRAYCDPYDHDLKSMLFSLQNADISVSKAASWLRHYILDGVKDPIASSDDQTRVMWLAKGLAEAVQNDSAPEEGGFDLAAGLFGVHVSNWIRMVAHSDDWWEAVEPIKVESE